VKSSDTGKKPGTTHPPQSMRSTTQSSASKERWRQPKTIMEFASQVNSVCNRVLNGKIDMEVAKTYSALARVVTQSANIEVAQARLSHAPPELRLDQMEDDGEED
jgi:hypothetical protein